MCCVSDTDDVCVTIIRQKISMINLRGLDPADVMMNGVQIS